MSNNSNSTTSHPSHLTHRSLISVVCNTKQLQTATHTPLAPITTYMTRIPPLAGTIAHARCREGALHTTLGSKCRTQLCVLLVPTHSINHATRLSAVQASYLYPRIDHFIRAGLFLSFTKWDSFQLNTGIVSIVIFNFASVEWPVLNLNK